MMYAYSHLAKGETCLKVYSIYTHDTVQPVYQVRAVLLRNNRVHYLPQHGPFLSFSLAESCHALLVLRCKEKGYDVCSSSCM